MLYPKAIESIIWSDQAYAPWSLKMRHTLCVGPCSTGHSQFVTNKGGIEMAAASLTHSPKILIRAVLGSTF